MFLTYDSEKSDEFSGKLQQPDSQRFFFKWSLSPPCAVNHSHCCSWPPMMSRRRRKLWIWNILMFIICFAEHCSFRALKSLTWSFSNTLSGKMNELAHDSMTIYTLHIYNLLSWHVFDNADYLWSWLCAAWWHSCSVCVHQVEIRWRGFIRQEVPEINQQGAAFTDSRCDLRDVTHTALY